VVGPSERLSDTSEVGMKILDDAPAEKLSNFSKERHTNSTISEQAGRSKCVHHRT